jgi:LPPG:FO 2-phospho-L-lactate transferase
MKIAALAGGVGGAKLAEGLAQILGPEDLAVVVNTGDDFEHYGLYISPDLDTVCYTLAGLESPQTGWGRAAETWNAFEALDALGGQTWFRLGDRDLGTHLERTHRLRLGQQLSEITRDFCRAWGVRHAVLPMSDEPAPTIVQTDEGDLSFQDYFVRRGCRPKVSGFRLRDGLPPAPRLLKVLAEADAVVICPSNPWVSIDPILAVAGVRQALTEKFVAAVTPIIAGRTVKGPAAKMYAEMGIAPSAASVAHHYQSFLNAFVIDQIDSGLKNEIVVKGPSVAVTNTLMKTSNNRKRLAEFILNFIEGELNR